MAQASNTKTSRRERSRPSGLTFRMGWGLLSLSIALLSTLLALVQPPYPHPFVPWTEWRLDEKLLYPFERNAGLRLPATPSDLNSMAFAQDNLHGVAVGAGGTVLITANGGHTWRTIDSGVSASLEAVTCSDAGDQVWAVGSAGTVLHSVNGGADWKKVEAFAGDSTILMAVAVHGADIWISGRDGTIRHSGDGGLTWTVQGRWEDYVRSIYFAADGKRGWAVGYSGIALATVDAGAHWQRQVSDAYTLNTVRFAADGLHGMATGNANIILATADGGRNWRQLADPDPTPQGSVEARAGFIFAALELMPDGQRAWAARDDGTIFRTQDGGATWRPQVSGAGGYISSIHFDPDGNAGEAVGENGTILTTGNGGGDWTMRISAGAAKLNAVRFDGSGQWGWAVGGAGTILATDDGGGTWTSRSYPFEDGGDRGGPVSLNDVWFTTDGQYGWAVGNGTIIATKDGGAHWAVQLDRNGASLNRVRFLSDGLQGWAVGGAGVVLHTTDGGRSWVQLSEPPRAPLINGFWFDAQGQQGWGVGSPRAIFSSTDGGQTWHSYYAPTDNPLNDVWFDASLQNGWIVGSAGTLLHTDNGGGSWIPQPIGSRANLLSVIFSPDGRRGWIGTDGGSVLVTHDSGKSWLSTDTKVGSTRTSLAMQPYGRKGWAVGYPPALLKTVDGGRTWSPMPWPLSYQRYLAPWFVLALLVALLCLFRAVRPVVVTVTSGVEAIGVTDAPIEDFAGDRLQFGPLARGISRFLRNSNTQPPLTLAITGDWGSGKSTLMELVCTDLRRFGTRPVWFNAWHHQTEESLLAALLNTIRDTGLPPSGSAEGIAFRLRLLWLRTRKYSVAVVAAAFGAVVLALLLRFFPDAWDHFLDLIGKAIKTLVPGTTKGDAANDDVPLDAWSNLGVVGVVIAQFLSVATIVTTIVKGLSAFSIDPAVLLSSLSDKFRLKDASDQTSFRTRFAEEFDEVTSALPYTPVIIVDDLDRCQPETVLTVLESVNFLVSSGKCFVIFGMATERVLAALALTFEKIADEVMDFDIAARPDAPPEVQADVERRRRHAYAQNYMEKLINLEVVVPRRADLPAYLLMDKAYMAPDANRFGFVEKYLEFWPTWLAAGLLAWGLAWGITLVDTSAHPPQPVVERGHADAAPAPPIAAPSPPGPVALGPAAPARMIAAPRYVPQMQDSNRYFVDMWTILGLTGLFVVIAAGLVRSRLRAAAARVDDTAAYRDALQIWATVVQKRRATPRGIKRFGNRLRYLAMLQQSDALEDSGFEKLWRRVQVRLLDVSNRSWARRLRGLLAIPPARHASLPPEVRIDEPILVALASLNEIIGDNWRDSFKPTAGETLDVAFEAGGEFDDVVRKAIAACGALEALQNKSSGFYWPPRSADLDKFAQLLKGVRVAGAPGPRV